MKMISTPSSILKSQSVRFIIAGGINTLSTYFLYLVLIYITSYKIAYGISYTSGIFISYILNSRFVFHVPYNWKKFIKFPIVYIIQYAISILGIFISIEYLYISKEIAPLIIILLNIPITFFISKTILTTRERERERERKKQSAIKTY